MSDSAYTTKGLPPAPAVSMTTMAMVGLLVDVFGLDELPEPSDDAPVTCLWLLHPRTRTRARMHDVARRAVHAWNTHQSQSQTQQSRRGLVALAFDMPNHGSRLVSDTANKTWKGGNERHAIDMAGIVRAARGDMSGLMDLVGGYLGREVDAHVALGWSLGGHAAWQAVFGEERLDAVVVVVGCPDYLGLMTHRAQNADLDTGSSPLLGSKYFPPDLIASCNAHDPRAILFGATSPPPLPTPPLPAAEQARLRAILDARGLRGKRVLVCSGADDALVPYARSAPLLAVLADAAGGWYRDAGLVLEDRVYEGVGHRFSADMVRDAVAFLVGAVAEGPRGEEGGADEGERKARI
ncbi:alpha/beta-Hydrolase [Hirsutella rhossiliensis]